MLLALVANAAFLAIVGVWAAARFSAAGGRTFASVRRTLAGSNGLWLATLVALASTAGSLWYSEVLHFEPCRLCWYQRIAMYPLVPILGIAAFRRDPKVRPYALTLAGVGLVISIYHNLLERFPQLETGVCSASVPCTARYVWKYGFVGIPYMAMSGFLLIIALVLVASAGEPQDAKIGASP